MNCREALELMYEYLDNELTSDQVERVRNHLAACAHCFERFEFENTLNEMLARRGQVEVDAEHLKVTIMQGVRELDQEEPTKGFFYRFRPYFAVATVLILVLIGLNFVLDGERSTLYAKVGPLIEYHNKCIHGTENGQLVPMQEDQIRACISGFLSDPEILLKPVSDRSAVFGEIVKCDKCDAAHVTYKYAETHVSVFIFRDNASPLPEVKDTIRTEKHEYLLVPVDGMNVVYWQCKGCWCAAVAKIDADGMISFLSVY